MSLFSQDELATDEDIENRIREIEKGFIEGKGYEIIANEILWSETPGGYDFWRPLYNNWKTRLDNIKPEENQNHQKNTGDTMKEINLLARAYYTQKGKRKKAAMEAIEEFFKKHMIVMDEPGSLSNIAGCPWTPQNTTFTGNIQYTALVQKFFLHTDGLTSEEYLELIAMYRHEKFGAHTWVKPECKQAYTEYLNGGSKKKTFWKSNTKKIYFDAEEKSVHFVDRKNGKEYAYTFTLEELV